MVLETFYIVCYNKKWIYNHGKERRDESVPGAILVYQKLCYLERLSPPTAHPFEWLASSFSLER